MDTGIKVRTGDNPMVAFLPRHLLQPWVRIVLELTGVSVFQHKQVLRSTSTLWGRSWVQKLPNLSQHC